MSAPPAGYGEIYDRGYRRYDGPRQGRLGSIWALARYSMARAVGLKKGWTSKIIPILLYVGSVLPVIVAIGIKAFVPTFNAIDYGTVFISIFLLEGIFVATIAPEMLCPDRREGTLPLYFSRPMTRGDYVTGKLVAAALLTLSIALTPQVILWLGNQLLSGSPLDAMRENLGDLGKVLLAGTAIAFYLGAIGLAISSFTRRKGIAVGIIIVGFTMSQALAAALTIALRDVQPWGEWAGFISPSLTVEALVTGLWPPASGQVSPLAIDAPLASALAVMAAVVALCCAVMYRRYGSRD
ncbi:MAG: ABC transporter permease [Chloroflexota bacterium]